MELSEYLRIIRRNWLLIVSSVALGLVIAGVISLTAAPTYTSTTKLFAATQNSDSVAELQQGNSFTQARIQSYAETATTPLVLQPVIESLGIEQSAADLATNIEATADLNTVLLTITASDQSPVQAAAVAQAVAESLAEAVEELETASEGGESPVKLSVVTPATAPSDPSAPNVQMNLTLGFAIGLLVGLACALIRTSMDTWIRGESDVTKLAEIPILGGISFDNDAMKKPLLTQASPQSPRAESFRQIRTNLQFSHVSHGAKAVLITSSLPGEGKSTTATNLAIAIAQSGQSVVLIDADLRRPRVSDYLGLERSAGLTTALIGRADVTDLLQPWGEDDLFVLTSGQIPPNPSELLGSTKMMELITNLESRFDAVIIDAPPLLPVTDAAVLAQRAGGVVMVVGASKLRTQDLEKSMASLKMVDADLLGVVLNFLPSRGPDAYAYSYYSSETPGPSTRKSSSKSVARSTSRSTESEFDKRVFGDKQPVTPDNWT